MSESVSLLIPFDIGQTYVFKPASVDRIENQWQQAFCGFPHWGWDQFPATFEKPLGCLARLDVCPLRVVQHSLGECKALRGLEQAANEIRSSFESLVPWAAPETLQITALFFPFGIGVLVVQLDLQWAAVSVVDKFRLDRNAIMASLKPLIAGCGDYYIFCLMQVATRKRKEGSGFLIKAQGVDRTERVKESAFLFPVFFVESRSYGRMVAGYPRENGGKGSRCAYDGAELFVAWTEAYAKNASVRSREYIVIDFVASLVSWYALSAMDRFAFSRSQEAFAVPATGHRSMQASEIRMMRLVYMDAINASNPVQWTTREKDLLLLERIHRVWGSSRLWNIEGRTALLESHYKAFETEEAEMRSGRLTRLALFVAIIAVTSVVADVAGLASEGTGLEGWLFRNRFQVTLSVFLGMIFLGLIGLVWQKRSKRM